jgi:hypothetical protein
MYRPTLWNKFSCYVFHLRTNRFPSSALYCSGTTFPGPKQSSLLVLPYFPNPFVARVQLYSIAALGTRSAGVPYTCSFTSQFLESYYLPQVAVECFHLGHGLLLLFELMVTEISPVRPQFVVPLLYTESSIRCPTIVLVY